MVRRLKEILKGNKGILSATSRI